MAIPIIGKFIGGNKPRPAPQPQEPSLAERTMQSQIGRQPAKQLQTPEQQHLRMLLEPGIDTKDRPYLKRHYLLAEEAARHLALANITDPFEYQRLNRLISDQFVVGGWSAPEYFEERQLKLFSRIQLSKSIGWTKNSRMIDSLNEQRITQNIRAEQNTGPRETHGFLQGLMR
jgi:hypothetical protein